jgi:hypothetical protein
MAAKWTADGQVALFHNSKENSFLWVVMLIENVSLLGADARVFLNFARTSAITISSGSSAVVVSNEEIVVEPIKSGTKLLGTFEVLQTLMEIPAKK